MSDVIFIQLFRILTKNDLGKGLGGTAIVKEISSYRLGKVTVMLEYEAPLGV